MLQINKLDVQRRALLSGMAALPLVAISPLAAADNKEVILLTWGGIMQMILEKEGFAERFKKETGYTVTLVPKSTSAEIIASALAQKAHPQVDVVMCDLLVWAQGEERGLFAPLSERTVPNLKYLVPSAKIGDKGASPYADILALLYNPEYFKKNGWAPPQTISELARPEFKGKLIFPPVSNTFGLYGLVELARANGGSETNIGPGFEALKKIAPSVVDWTSTHAKMVNMFQQESAVVALYANGPGYDMRNRGAPVDVIIPKPSYLSNTVAGITENAPNPTGAAVLLNWIIGKDLLTYRAEKYGNTPLNTQVKIEGPAAKQVVQGDQLNSLLQINYQEAMKRRNDWVQRFEREILPLR
jgi:putative spermidine/putrescine transport system substrate-binding protein